MKKGKALSRKVLVFRLVLTIVAIIALGVLAYPFFPTLQYELGLIGDKNETIVSLVPQEPGRRIDENAPDINTLVIPKIGVEMPIVEGEDESALDDGAWRIPHTSEPDLGGNTVVSGHRFKFLPPSSETFYLLDKMEIGDQFTIYWEKIRYDYEIFETKVVEPTAVEIQDNTEDSRVTIFTCTPLFSTAQRLVVIGTLLEY
ncbi:sortase [Patescibacteria group bacterium]|nr:sortase [Patescibacteria group bacterium]MBU1890378.1 sortase [Patescibacteria group bacterium]